MQHDNMQHDNVADVWAPFGWKQTLHVAREDSWGVVRTRCGSISRLRQVVKQSNWDDIAAERRPRKCTRCYTATST